MGFSNFRSLLLLFSFFLVSVYNLYLLDCTSVECIVTCRHVVRDSLSNHVIIPSRNHEYGQYIPRDCWTVSDFREKGLHSRNADPTTPVPLIYIVKEPWASWEACDWNHTRNRWVAQTPSTFKDPKSIHEAILKSTCMPWTFIFPSVEVSIVLLLNSLIFFFTLLVWTTFLPSPSPGFCVPIAQMHCCEVPRRKASGGWPQLFFPSNSWL